MPRRKKGSSTGDAGKSSSSLSINKGKPIQRNAANARERARMRVLSRAFCRLKTTLPWVPADTKLSKLDTLRLATSYIAHLKGILSDDPYSSDPGEPTSHPAMSLTWPFGFNRPATLMEGNGSSVGGGSEAEESISSSCWEPESPTKDCVHLENPSQPDLLSNKHIQQNMQLNQESNYKSHNNNSVNHQNLDISNNNNVIPYNFHQNHHQHSTMPYSFQTDVIMSIS